MNSLGDRMGVFGSADVQLAEAVKELGTQQQQQQQQQQQEHHLLLQKLAEEHHQQLLQQQQQQQQQQQEQSLRLQQMSFHGGSDGCPPAVEARLLLLEQVL